MELRSFFRKKIGDKICWGKGINDALRGWFKYLAGKILLT
jgi:hypothetical protein